MRYDELNIYVQHQRSRFKQWRADHLRPDWKWQVCHSFVMCASIALLTALVLNLEIGKCR